MGDPNVAIIHSLTGDCLASEPLANASDADEGFRAVGLAVDGRAVHLTVPGTGIVLHPFAAGTACSRIG